MKSSTTGLTLGNDSAIDLHLHTINSDGHWSPEALLDYLLREQFDLAAITDHDRTDTITTIQQLAQDRHLPVLVGVEMTTTWKGELVDLLCYGFDPEHNALNNLTDDLLQRQQENTREVFEKLQQQGFTLPPESISALLATPSAQQMHEFVPLLKKHGYGLGEPSAGRLVWEAGPPEFATNEPAAVVEAAHRSGAVCLLAHPGHEEGFVTFDGPLLDEFRHDAPIDGIEVYHPLHTPVKTEMYREYAQCHHMLISAGSDSHKPEKPPIKYHANLCLDLLERLGIQIK